MVKRLISILLSIAMLLGLFVTTVQAAAALTITQQPKSVTVAEGEKATATVKATGDGLTYRWYFKDKGAADYTYTSSFKGNSYYIAMNAARDGRRVLCKITDKYGNTVKTQSVTLNMKKVATIVTQPKSVTVAEGAKATVTVKATGDGLTYKWYYKDAGMSDYKYTSSFTGNSYYVTMSAARDGRRVLCKITDKYGNTVKTQSVTLNMKKVATIVTQPKSVTVAEGAKATVTVKATGDGLTYKWYYKDTGMSDYKYTSSFKSNTYSVAMSAARNGRRVLCKITDKYGNTVKTKSVTLNMKSAGPTITKQPVDVGLVAGDYMQFTVAVSGGTAPYEYQWYYYDPALPEYGFQLISNEWDWIGGANSQTLFMEAVGEADFGMRFYCEIHDANNKSVTTNTAELCRKAAITQQPVSVNAENGATAKVSFTVAGKGLTYTWYFKNKDASTFSKTTAFTGNTYSIEMNESRDGRQVYCVVEDKFGNSVQTNTVTLSMGTPLVITAQPQNDRSNPGDQATFTVAVSGGKAPYTYQWQMRDYNFDWENLTNGSWFTGVNTNRLDLIVDRDEFVNENKYRCVITDANGTQIVSDAAWVEENVLRITTQPQPAYVNEFDTATYRVTVTGGVAPYTYKWQQVQGSSPVDITGKTGDGTEKYTGWNTNTLTVKVTSYDFAYSRKYRCVITDATGKTVTSEVGDVYSPLRFITQPVDVETYSSNAGFSAEAAGGLGPYTYTWQCYTNTGWSDLTEDMIFKPEGQGTEVLRVLIPNEELFGMQFRCIVTDANGETAISDTVHVYKRFSADLSHSTLYFDRDDPLVSVTVVVTPGSLEGKGPYTYRWHRWYSDTKTWHSDSTWDPDDNTYNAYWSYDEVTMQVYCEVKDADGNIARTQTLTIYSSK